MCCGGSHQSHQRSWVWIVQILMSRWRTVLVVRWQYGKIVQQQWVLLIKMSFPLRWLWTLSHYAITVATGVVATTLSTTSYNACVMSHQSCTCLFYCTGAQLEQKQALGIPKHILGQDFCGSGNCAKSKLHSRGKDWKTEGISPVLYQWILCEIHEGGRPMPTWKPVAENWCSPFFLRVFGVLWYFSHFVYPSVTWCE